MSKERPILFSGPMILAILEGRKTQTRRVLKHPECYGCPTGDCPHSTQNECDQAMNDQSVIADSPYGVPGDRLWVREKFGAFKESSKECSPSEATYVVLEDGTQVYRDGSIYPGLSSYNEGAFWFKWRPSIHMPRWASRITPQVTGVRVERLDSISDADCVAEGCAGGNGSIPNYGFSATPREHYRHVWESINGKGSWDANPWVWVVEFKRIAQAVSA